MLTTALIRKPQCDDLRSGAMEGEAGAPVMQSVVKSTDEASMQASDLSTCRQTSVRLENDAGADDEHGVAIRANGIGSPRNTRATPDPAASAIDAGTVA